jgi:SAM-dependent methyltransferase
VCGDLLDLAALELERVDLVLSIGVLHHLPDDVAVVALRSALSSLASGGRLITMDPSFEPSQRSTARVLMALDRGKFVRHPADYRRLVEAAGGVVDQQIWHDVYRFPYTHCVQSVTPT